MHDTHNLFNNRRNELKFPKEFIYIIFEKYLPLILTISGSFAKGKEINTSNTIYQLEKYTFNHLNAMKFIYSYTINLILVGVCLG